MLNNAVFTPYITPGAEIGVINTGLTSGLTFVIIIIVTLGSDISTGPTSGSAFVLGVIFGASPGYTSIGICPTKGKVEIFPDFLPVLPGAVIVVILIARLTSGVTSGLAYGGAHVVIIVGFISGVTCAIASGGGFVVVVITSAVLIQRLESAAD